MARAAITTTVIDAAGNAKAGVSVEVRRRSDNALMTLFVAETGGTTSPNPAITNSDGRIPNVYVERGAYKLTISGGSPPIAPYVEHWEAAPASDASVDTAWLAGGFIPIGCILGYGGTSDPAGGAWLICDGRAVSRATYAGLFNVISTVFGTGDGSTTFNLPDTRGRTLVGAGTGSGLTARTRGDKIGEEGHLQAASELHPHSHTLQDTGGFGPDVTNTTLDAGGVGVYRRAVFPGTLQTTLSGGVSPGVWNKMNVVQPSLVTSHIIRAL